MSSALKRMCYYSRVWPLPDAPPRSANSGPVQSTEELGLINWSGQTAPRMPDRFATKQRPRALLSTSIVFSLPAI